MNDPITLAATDREDRPEIPDTTPPGAPGAPGTEPVRTLLDTAATCRPLEEVTALVSLLKDTGRRPNPGHEALRTAAVTRPVHEVRQMVALLGEPPHEVDAADITLRAAAVGRPIEEVAQLVHILGTGEPAQSEASKEPAEESYEKPRGQARPQPEPEQARSGPPVLRHVLRWPAAVNLLVTGALHLPRDVAALPSAAPVDVLPLLVTVLCVGFGALLALRDTTTVWRAGAATAVGVVALHVFGGAAAFDPLAGAVGGSLAWADSVAVLSAAAGAVLAGLALRNRPERPA